MAAGLVFGVIRIVLGALWLHEGLFKYAAHFGRADILLVVSSVNQNNRVDPLFKLFTNAVLHAFPGFFGFVVPLVESALGVALILGVLTLPAAAVSLLELMNYWSSDQLVPQYPIMGVLSVVTVACAGYASLFSITSLLVWRARRGQDSREQRLATWSNDGPPRRWL
jgi:thiosulfate dehydrogenase [quinone] large subunit